MAVDAEPSLAGSGYALGHSGGAGREAGKRRRVGGQDRSLPSQRLPGGAVPRGWRVSARTSVAAGSKVVACWLRGAELLGLGAFTGCVPLGGCASGEP